MTERVPRAVLASVLLLALSLSAPRPALAQNREHLQIFADLRMLQENIARLQKAAADLDEQIRTVNKRLDDQNAATVKAFADQRLLINGLGASVITLREKLDDNAVAVRQLTPEVSAIRDGVGILTTLLNQMLGLLQPPAGALAAPGTDVAAPGMPPTAGAPPAGAGAVAMPPSPKALYDQAMGNFTSNRLALAIEGFQELIDKFPNATDYAADAQFGIGDSYFYQGKYKEALTAYQLVVSKYPASRKVPEALLAQGLCHQRLGQKDAAIKVYTTLLTSHKDTTAALQATQALKGMNVIK
jgi:tol-pal system protein YbgF